MKKLSLVALKSDADRLVRELVYLRSVQLTPLDKADGLLPAVPAASSGGDLESVHMQQVMQNALALVAKHRKKHNGDTDIKRSDFENILKDHAPAIRVAGRLWDIVTETESVSTGISEVKQQQLFLLPWLSMVLAPAACETASTKTVAGTAPLTVSLSAVFDTEDAPDVVLEQINTDPARQYVTVTYLKNREPEVASVLNNAGFTRIDLDKSVQNVQSSYDRLQARLSELETKQSELATEIQSYAEYAPEFELLYDYYGFKVTGVTVKDKLFYTQNAVLLQGWVPQLALPLMERVLADFECYYELEDPTESEEPPVLLKNGWFSAPFEFIISLYAYPKYRAFDPTKLVAFFFFFTFGFMVQDIAYGILMLLGCTGFILIKKPKGQFRQTLKMFALCGISTIFAGALFGGFFGDLPQSFANNMLGIEGEVDVALWFSPLSDPMTMLYFSLGVGIFQVIVGMLVDAYMKFKRHEFHAAITDDLSWLIIFIGLGMFGAASFGLADLPWLSDAGMYTALAGVAIIVLFKAKGVKNPILRLGKGLLGLYSVVNLASDILSYSRIMALGLSGAVIANVMNLLGTLGGPTITGFILFAVLLVVGTALNLFISLLGAFVHTARLQYIEFFGKFYEEGGEIFIPAAAENKYTNIILEETK